MSGQSSLPSIAIDNFAIGRMATEHLLNGGARRIGIITGPLNWWEARERLRGWRETLPSGASPPTSRASSRVTDRAKRRGRARQPVGDRPDIDAVLACNDQMALGVLHGAHRLGRPIPDGLSVVGVDNIAEGSHYWPSLTTVHQPLRDAGALAVRTIDELIERSNDDRRERPAIAQSRLLAPELIVRESSRRSRATDGSKTAARLPDPTT
jgi:LacI family transcriptional regulator